MDLRLASVVAGLSILSLALGACAAEAPADDAVDPTDLAPVTWSPAGKADFAGVPAVFDRNTIMTDAVFTATDAVDRDAIQGFLENTPYHTRSWLADETINGARFADVVGDVADSRGLDPVMLLARMQVESSLVSATVRPSRRRVDFALGCGCPDGGGCSEAYRGLDKQLACAADTMMGRFRDSVDHSGEWRVGRTGTTLDDYAVRPTTNATASLYAYTPWVLPKRGGTWLVWNVTRRYLKGFDEAGKLHLP
jgi:hypothetical protein